MQVLACYVLLMNMLFVYPGSFSAEPEAVLELVGVSQEGLGVR